MERATSTSAAGSFGERTILVGTAVSFLLESLRQRDDAGGGEALDLALRQAELAEHLGGVLAEPRSRTPDPSGRRRRPDREVEHARGPVARLLDRFHQAQVLHLRVLEDLVEFVDRTGGHLLGLESRDPHGGRLVPQPALNARLARGWVRDAPCA